MMVLGEPYERVSLDYDIYYLVDATDEETKEDLQIRVESPENFTAVARFIARMPDKYRPEIEYHTANPEGEQEMKTILDGAGVPE